MEEVQPQGIPLFGKSIVSILAICGENWGAGAGGGGGEQQVERVKALDCDLGRGFVLTEQGPSLEKGWESHSQG